MYYIYIKRFFPSNKEINSVKYDVSTAGDKSLLTCYLVNLQGDQDNFFTKEMLTYISFNFEVTQKSLNMGRFDNYTFYLNK